MLTLLASLCLLSPLAPGTYTPAELCARLSQTEGPVSVSAELDDYPLYLSLKDPTPKRIEEMMAAALGGQWVRRSQTLQLVPATPAKTADLEEFDRQLKIAFKGKPYEGLPARELHDMTPGTMERFGTKPSDLIQELPDAMQSAAGGKPQYWRVLRMIYGVFSVTGTGPAGNVAAFSQDDQSEFNSIPPAVVALLKSDMDQTVPANPELKKLTDTVGDRVAASPKADPAAILVGAALQGLGEKVQKDLVIAIPDGAILILGDLMQEAHAVTVKQRLASLSCVLNWTIVDDAVVGELPPIESFSRGQSRRELLRNTILEFAGGRFVDMGKFSENVAAQRPTASDTWVDAMILSVCRVGLDQEFIADYPYNARLYSDLTDRDWALLKTGRPFRASGLSDQAQTQLETLLTQSRACTEAENSDPVLWPSLAPADLVLTASYAHEQVFVLWETGGSRVGPASDVVYEYQSLKKNGKEPLFQLGDRQKITLRITALNGQHAKTGFSNVVIPPGQRPVAWTELPADAAADFKKALDTLAARPVQPRTGTPPP